ncbi:hypothetical protein AYO47_03455 [Planctomyces sp. SCGC AG-212-M04]|nr:hypothetical protein AYO47_03455 [Planctomyces sp. SCGC AG-212-M04]
MDPGAFTTLQFNRRFQPIDRQEGPHHRTEDICLGWYRFTCPFSRQVSDEENDGFAVEEQFVELLESSVTLVAVDALKRGEVARDLSEMFKASGTDDHTVRIKN